MLVATLFTASDAQAFALGNHAGGFFLGTLDCAGVDDSGTRNPCRENGWLNYDTLSGYCVAANKIPDTLARVVPDNPITRASNSLGRPGASDVLCHSCR